MTSTLEQRIILDRVEVDPATGCWNWTGSLRQGYGQIWTSAAGGAPRRILSTHRAMYELKVGPIPDGLDLDHLCRNTVCCNPAHLEPVTRRVNILRGQCPAAANARQATCSAGHRYDATNQNGSRRCTTCDPLNTGSRSCPQCSVLFTQVGGGRRRRFCTDQCRIDFHNSRQALV